MIIHSTTAPDVETLDMIDLYSATSPVVHGFNNIESFWSATISPRRSDRPRLVPELWRSSSRLHHLMMYLSTQQLCVTDPSSVFTDREPLCKETTTAGFGESPATQFDLEYEVEVDLPPRSTFRFMARIAKVSDAVPPVVGPEE